MIDHLSNGPLFSSAQSRPVPLGQPGSPGAHYGSITPSTAKNTPITFHYSWHCQPPDSQLGIKNPQFLFPWPITIQLHLSQKHPDSPSGEAEITKSTFWILWVNSAEQAFIVISFHPLTLAPSWLYFQCFTSWRTMPHKIKLLFLSQKTVSSQLQPCAIVTDGFQFEENLFIAYWNMRRWSLEKCTLHLAPRKVFPRSTSVSR